MDDDQPFPTPADILPVAMNVSYDVWDSLPLPAPRLFYPLHNPVGPRFYKNIHLIPPSQFRPGARPPSVFSPSFPPISTQTQISTVDHSDTGPSRTTSHSTLPTPSSSQTRVADPNKPRSRKTSQSAPDNVDLMDVTDPWGTNWHHTSPYDIGLPAGAGSADPHDARRPRRASMTATQNGYKSTFKSPLSQSTSAVHELPPIQMPRKLSKRQRPPTTNGKDKELEASQEHVPATHTVEHNPSLPKRMSQAPPVGQDASLAARPSLNKKEKRGSVLGRLARKFSDMRRSFDGYGRSQRSEDDWHHVSPAETTTRESVNHPNELPNSTQERAPAKRVPPPSIDDLNHQRQPSQSTSPPRHEAEGDSASSVSVEAPFSIGKLTIANPDILTPSDEGAAPAPLPPEKEKLLQSGYPPKLAQIPSPPPSPAPPTLPAKDDDSPAESPHLGIPSAPSSSDSQMTPRPVERALSSDSTYIPNPVTATTPISPVPGLRPPSSPVTSKQRISSRYSTAPSYPQSPPQHLRTRPASTVESVGSRTSMYTAATATSSVPFPGATPSTAAATTSLPNPNSSETYPGGDYRPNSYLSYADTPMTGISVLANPPTPYTPGELRMMPDTPDPSPHVPIPPAKPVVGKSPLAQAPMTSSPSPPPQASTSKVVPPQQITPESSQSTTHSSTRRATVTSSMKDLPPVRQSAIGAPGGSRQTETFKLVRSGSGHGHVYASGEQWGVVEEREKEREREREREREKAKRESRREKEKEREKRESKQMEEERTHRRRSHRNTLKPTPPEPQPQASSSLHARSASNQGHAREPSGSKGDEFARREREEQTRREREEQAKREREREEYARKEREEQVRREREEQMRREKEKEREREREREREERARREREREGEREREEQIRREMEEQIRKEREVHARWEREEQRRREKEREREREREREKREREREERERKEREREERERKEKEKEDREKEKERERKEREREERKAREREERKKEERKSKDDKEKDRKERRSKDEHKHRNEDKDRRRSKGEHHRSRDKDDKDREKPSRRRDKERKDRGPKPNLNKPTPPPPPPTPSSNSSSSTDAQPPTDHLGRQPSTSARPTSELPSAAELNAMRAKEAWEMERLWKARSVYGTEANGVVFPAGGATQINGSSSTVGVETHTHAQVAMSMGMNLGPGTANSVHGSSHTAFVVQNSHAAQQPYPHHPHLYRPSHLGGGAGGGIYAMHPPPIAAGMVSAGSGSGYCPSPPTIPSLHDSITSYEIPNPSSLTPLMMNGPYRYGAYHGLYGGSSPGLIGSTVNTTGGVPGAGAVMGRGAGVSGGGLGGNNVVAKERYDKDLPPLENPLPMPPRESVYEPGKLTSEYWAKYSSELTSSV